MGIFAHASRIFVRAFLGYSITLTILCIVILRVLDPQSAEIFREFVKPYVIGVVLAAFIFFLLEGIVLL